MKLNKIKIKNISNSEPLIIAGPCSAESREQLLASATELKAQGIKILRAGIWKPRTKPGGFEGVGAIGLEWMREAAQLTSMQSAIEVATPEHVEEALSAGIDILWIGARTTTNPFAVQQLSDSLRGTSLPIFVKNPVNPDIELWCGALERLYNAGVKNIGAIHRGFSTYNQEQYRNLPLWHIPIELRRRYPELTILTDPSHIGGRRTLIAPISQQALDLNFDGLVIESHCNPDCALSDSAQQITPTELSHIISELVVRNSSGSLAPNISTLREKIDSIDEDILRLLHSRMEISKEIGIYKRENNLPVLQSTRYSEILGQRISKAASLSLSEEFIREIMQSIHKESIAEQIKLMKPKP
ncbi:MAG: bifunctional 3-deoxy-7-phosphoheptulonate synthase/chorismate mutase type II [Rikenellaceae bacterium]